MMMPCHALIAPLVIAALPFGSDVISLDIPRVDRSLPVGVFPAPVPPTELTPEAGVPLPFENPVCPVPVHCLPEGELPPVPVCPPVAETPPAADSPAAASQAGAVPAACPASTAIFDEPAYFPLIAFTDTSLPVVPVAQDAILIYEGMVVEIRDDGFYEIRMMLESPKTLAVLRLQLHVTCNGQPLGTITIPPFTLMPDLSDQVVLTQSWRLVHRGYSHKLRGLAASGGVAVSRTGVARIGSLPE